MEKKCSIIIPTKDKNSRLYLTLKCLEPQVDENTEVLVVFDGCTKETIDEFNTFKWNMNVQKVISVQNVGRAAARNLGIATDSQRRTSSRAICQGTPATPA